MKTLILVVVAFLFYGCNSTSQLELSSSPNGAKIYDTTTNQYLGRTPLELTYIYDSDPKTPKCELLRPITAIWGDNEAKVTERSLIVCPGKDYKMLIGKVAFSKAKNYKLVENDEVWNINPYIGVSLDSSHIVFDTSDLSQKSNSTTYRYKIGFIDEDDNRFEINYALYDFEENDMSFYSLDTIIPFYEEQVRPYFKFGLGYHNYEYDLEEYSSVNYNFGLGVLGSMSESIEVDLGISTKRHLNTSSLAKSAGFKGVDSPDSKLDLKTIVMGVNYKF